uniref:Uncharacterized protein n=1 Tax=Rhipicephalus appendiculatus TaxID=34631 RepID=A0A131Y986_RHIAP
MIYQNTFDNASQIHKKRLSNHMEHISVISSVRTHKETACAFHAAQSPCSGRWRIEYHNVFIVISALQEHFNYQDCDAVIVNKKLDPPKPDKYSRNVRH